MRNYILHIILLLALLFPTVSAFTYEQYTRDAYDFEPIENANVSLYYYNGTLIDYEMSDSTGWVEFPGLGIEADGYNITTQKNGYNTDDRWRNLTEDTTGIVYLTQLSYSSVKVIFDDTTLNPHQICFYDQNGWLKGCYDENDTIIFLDGNYTMHVKEHLYDKASNPTNFLSIALQYGPYLFMFVLVLGFILGVILLMLTYVIRRIIR